MDFYIDHRCIIEGKHCVRQRAKPCLPDGGQNQLKICPFFFVGIKKMYQFLTFFQNFFVKNRPSENIIENIFPRWGKRLIDLYKDPIHIQIVPGNIINIKFPVFFSTEIMGNTLQIIRGIFSFRNFSENSFYSVFLSFFPLVIVPCHHDNKQHNNSYCPQDHL